MTTQYLIVALVLSAVYYIYKMIKDRNASAAVATLEETASPLVLLTPKIPSSADAFSATEVLTARLRAVGLPAEEIAAIRRPILENMSKEVTKTQ